MVAMVIILNNFSFQLARCMFNFRDAGIKKQEPLCMAIINSNEKVLFVILAMISISKMKNSVYNWIGGFLHVTIV